MGLPTSAFPRMKSRCNWLTRLQEQSLLDGLLAEAPRDPKGQASPFGGQLAAGLGDAGRCWEMLGDVGMCLEVIDSDRPQPPGTWWTSVFLVLTDSESDFWWICPAHAPWSDGHAWGHHIVWQGLHVKGSEKSKKVSVYVQHMYHHDLKPSAFFSCLAAFKQELRNSNVF